MSTFLKVALALVLTLPLGAYVAGTLVAAQVDMPAERAPVVIDDGSAPVAPSPTAPDPSPSRGPDDRGGEPEDESDDRDRDRDRDGDDDDTVRVIRPTPHDVDDDTHLDDGDDSGDREGGDDS